MEDRRVRDGRSDRRSYREKKEPKEQIDKDYDRDYDRDSGYWDSSYSRTERRHHSYRSKEEDKEWPQEGDYGKGKTDYGKDRDKDRDREHRRHDRHDRNERYERSERSDRGDRSDYSERHDRHGQGYDRHERQRYAPPERTEYGDKYAQYGDSKTSDSRPVQIVTRPRILDPSSGQQKQRDKSPARQDGQGQESEPLKTSAPEGSQSQAKKKPQLVVPVLGPMYQRCRLMDEEWRLCVDSVSPHLLEHGTDFQIVACIGSQGVGKSTVLSLLQSPLMRGLDSSSKASGGARAAKVPFEAPLPIHSAKAFMEGIASPTGVDVCVSAIDRLILLDAQPLFDSISTSPEADLKCELYLLIFLTSICHSLLVVTDTPVDTQLWKFLRLLATLKEKVPNLATWLRKSKDGDNHRNSVQQQAQQVLPHLLVIFNNLSKEDGEDEALYAPVRRFLQHSSWKEAPSMHFTTVPSLPGTSIEELLTSDAAAVTGIRLREKIFASGPQRGRFGCEGLQLSERQWLYNVSMYWDFVQKNAEVQDYLDVLSEGVESFVWPKLNS
eukprot:TRINITY_DN15506_c0_g1_i2.p1 TRINITY_DN15506_c0_g1~~TRINITY_DN15506_c0_g1_i2.p1  ORF type:complete len:552 (+),score=78.75 TRINITY_DN15506_c0_g1_i2:45-1700(+)